VRRAPRTDYEAIAPSYDEDRKHWEIPPDDVIAGANGALDVLDVGCGTGLWLTAQRTHYPDAPVRWTGLDPSAGMLREAREKAPDLDLVHAFAEAMPFAANAFDYVYSSFVYHHFADKDAAFDEIARVLRPHGTFRIRHIDPEHMPGWWVYRYFPKTRDLDDLRFWANERLHDAFEQRGFDVEVALQPEVQSRPAAEIIEEAERRVVSQIAILDDGAYAEGLALLRAADPAQPIESDWARIAITATKRP
jgi:SAM-dependent methyltransferase